MHRRTFLQIGLAALPALVCGDTVTLARRLLMAGGGGGAFVRPTPVAFTVIAPPDGGWWSEANQPHAMYAEGKTYMGWIGGDSHPNDVEVAAWDHVTETLSGPFLLHDHFTPTGSDDPDRHNAPAILVRHDGHILAVYSGHQETEIHARVSTDPYDISAFEAEFSLDPIAGEFTYPFLAQLTDASDRIYLLIRRNAPGGGSYDYVLTYSDDGGETWAAGLGFYNPLGDPTSVYGTFGTNSVDRIDFAVLNRSFDEPGGFGLFHGYMDAAGDVFKTDGTEITGFSYPLTSTDLTEVVADGGDAYPYAIVYTDDGRPVISCQTQQADPVELFEYRWSGSAWERHDITTSEGFDGGTSVGGGMHSYADANRFLTGRIIDGDTSVWLYTSSDDGETWTGEQVATTDPPPSPVNVRDEGEGLAFLWFTGEFDVTSFDVGLDAIG